MNKKDPEDLKKQKPEMWSSKEDSIHDLMEEIQEPTSKEESKDDSKIKEWFDDIAFDISWRMNRYIWAPIRNFKKGIHNLIMYRRLIWRDRWWDYSFFMEMLLFKLKDTEEHWGRDTHYRGDQDDKDTLKKLVEDLEWLVNTEEFSPDYEKEYKKRSRSFFGRLDRNHRKFWD